MFGTLSITEDTEINYKNNFRNFPNAMMLLFRASTGEGWHDIMLSCKAGAECDPAVIVPGSDKTCGNIVAVPFFISFVFFVQFLMLNLFVAVIMDNFEFLTRDSSILGPQHLDKFPEAWSDLDPHATGFIAVMELKKLVSRLHPPLGMGDNAPERLVYKRLIETNIPVNEEGQVSFHHTLVALIRTSLQIRKISKEESKEVTFERQKELDREVRYEMKRKWTQLSPEQLNDIVPDPDNKYDFTSGKIFGIFLMFQHWKIYNQRKVAIAEAKKKVEEQRAVAEKLERLEILEEEITTMRRDSRLSSLPPTGLDNGVDSDFLVRRNGELKNSILSMMAPVGIATNSIKSRPIPKPRSSSINSTSSQRGLLLSNIKSTNLSEVQGHVNAGYDIVSDNISDEVFIDNRRPVERVVTENKTELDTLETIVPPVPNVIPSNIPTGTSSTVQSVAPSEVLNGVSNEVFAKQHPFDASYKAVGSNNFDAKEPDNRLQRSSIRRPSKVKSSLLDNLNNLSKDSDVSEIKMAETFTNSVIKSAVIYAPNEAQTDDVLMTDTVAHAFPTVTLTLTAAGNELLNEKWPNQESNSNPMVNDNTGQTESNKMVDDPNETIIYDDEDLPL